MNVYRIYLNLDKFQFLSASSRKDLQRIMFQPQGQPFHESWTLPRYDYCPTDDEDYRPNAIEGDFISVDREIGLTAEAVKKIGPIFENYGELLPLDVNGDLNKVFWFHCTRVLDALDESKSKVKRFPNGRIMAVDKYAFLSDRIGATELFHLKEERGHAFCTEAFKQKIESENLTGLEFRLLWSDEPAGTNAACVMWAGHRRR
jgi:hypothetical protein